FTESFRPRLRRTAPQGGLTLTLFGGVRRLGAGSAPSSPDRDDAPLLPLADRVKENDLSAFERLYQLTREDASRTLFHLVGRRADVEDLLQETYLQLLKALPSFRGEARFKTFLYRICANVAVSHLRWSRR